MMSVETVLDCVNNYKVQNGIVYDKRTNQEVKDETIVLIVKTSRLLYAKAKELNEKDKSRNKNSSREDCINRAIDRFGFSDNDYVYTENKIIKSILTTGIYQENIFNNKIDNYPEYINFVGANKDYTLALLKLKARQQGYDVQDINFNMDTSNYQKDGNSIITITCPMTRYVPQKDTVSLAEFNSMSDCLKETFLTTKREEFQAAGNKRVVNEYTELLDMTRNGKIKQSNEVQQSMNQTESTLKPKEEDIIIEWQEVPTHVKEVTQQKSPIETIIDDNLQRYRGGENAFFNDLGMTMDEYSMLDYRIRTSENNGMSGWTARSDLGNQLDSMIIPQELRETYRNAHIINSGLDLPNMYGIMNDQEENGIMRFKTTEELENDRNIRLSYLSQANDLTNEEKIQKSQAINNLYNYYNLFSKRKDMALGMTDTYSAGMQK